MDIIAEIGQNHNGDMRLASRMIKIAKENGADAVKFQVYDAHKLFSRKDNPWFEYNCKTELSRKHVEFLARECRKERIEFMASVFDVERIAWLEGVGIKRYKIASRSINDSKLIEAVVSTGKPVIISLGCWHKKTFPKINSKAPVEFLYCVAKYPALMEDLKLASVDFKKYAGFSDHSIGITAALVALARGARIIEKHFTLDKKLFGPDHMCSMNPNELNRVNVFRTEIKRCL